MYVVQYLQHFLNVHLHHIATAAVQQSQAYSEHNRQALQKEGDYHNIIGVDGEGGMITDMCCQSLRCL